MTTLEIIFSIIGFLLTMLASIIAFFASRTLHQIDTNMKEMMEDLNSLKEQLIRSNELVEFLKQELATVKRKCEVLQRAFTKIDKVLYSKNININHSDDETV